MDIRTAGGPATEEEIAAVDGLLGSPESLWEGGERHPADDHVAFGGRALRSQRHLLLPVLHAIQDRVGWVSRGALEYACRRLSIPPAEAYGVVSFYARFALEPRAEVTLHVCDDISCMLAGAKVVEGGRPVPCLGRRRWLSDPASRTMSARSRRSTRRRIGCNRHRQPPEGRVLWRRSSCAGSL